MSTIKELSDLVKLIKPMAEGEAKTALLGVARNLADGLTSDIDSDVEAFKPVTEAVREIRSVGLSSASRELGLDLRGAFMVPTVALGIATLGIGDHTCPVCQTLHKGVGHGGLIDPEATKAANVAVKGLLPDGFELVIGDRLNELFGEAVARKRRIGAGNGTTQDRGECGNVGDKWHFHYGNEDFYGLAVEVENAIRIRILNGHAKGQLATSLTNFCKLNAVKAYRHGDGDPVLQKDRADKWPSINGVRHTNKVDAFPEGIEA